MTSHLRKIEDFLTNSWAIFLRADQDEPAKVGGDQEMTILKEMNAFEDDHERFMDSLKGVI